jgi:Fe-S-cluster-containing hydrogenase component 2
MSEKLVINLDLCRDCAVCTAACAYPYHPSNNGVARLRELAAQELVCRRCEARSCVEACPNEALEQQADGALRRWNMRCTGCLSCSHACPFGTIIPAATQFRDSACDFCAGLEGKVPACAATCPLHAISLEEAPADAPGLHLLGENLAVRTTIWQKTEPARAR